MHDFYFISSKTTSTNIRKQADYSQGIVMLFADIDVGL
jgi:hypothetical protein